MIGLTFFRMLSFFFFFSCVCVCARKRVHPIYFRLILREEEKEKKEKKSGETNEKKKKPCFGCVAEPSPKPGVRV